MRSLQEILKDNGQDPNLAYQTGEFVFDPKAGCLVYQPPGIKKPKAEGEEDGPIQGPEARDLPAAIGSR